jgi:hypothetical protein
MKRRITRRKLLKDTALSAAYLAASGTSSTFQGTIPPTTQPIVPLTSTSGVFIPPRGRGFMKFSFDFPEPSVEFGGIQLSFRLYTFENTYALDPDAMQVTHHDGTLQLTCSSFVWAGGQQRGSGKLQAEVRKAGSFTEWSVRAEMHQPIKSVAAIVRGVPRGKVSAGGASFFDPRDDEILLGYPFGGGSLFTAGSMNTPLVVIQAGEQEFFFLSALNQQVRNNRFYLQPGEAGYRAELIYENAGWERRASIESPVWRGGRARTAEEAFRPHFEHLERTFAIPDWDRRHDVPAWFRKVALVVVPHGMHWTGYVFNDYAKISQTLEWIAMRIPPDRVLVFLPAWDGRYYWKYPDYEPDPRLGGPEGFRKLIDGGHRLGFRFMPMFGTNSANRNLASFRHFADATTSRIDGDPLYLNWVDWDNDRYFEGWAPYMNVGVESWRQWLFERISQTLDRFKADAYFLDIAGGWENNTAADMHAGLQRLVADLRTRHPGVLACGEMHYDALMSFLPVYQVFSERAYPAAFSQYCRAFQHLSHPAPGRGSSGVHESGFARFDPQTFSLNDNQIPTLTIVDDTFEKYRHVMDQVIRKAKQRARIT